MPKKRNENKKLLIAFAVVLIGLVLGGILYFNKFQKSDLPLTDNKINIPEKAENNNIKSIVKTDKAIKTDETTKADEIAISDKKVKADKTINTALIETKNKKITASDKTGMTNGTVGGRIVVLPDIDYKNLKKNKALKQLMVSRKQKLGLKKSLDMIVNSDESFKIGDVQIPLRDILEKSSLKEGTVFEEKIEDSGAVQPEKIKKFGIYVVQPGDNIWNIHFNILKEFYEHQGIKISHKADEPLNGGMSSGVGKILKFSETMVIIYNFVDQKIEKNIELLEPLSKIIVYNMDEIFSLLQEVNYKNIDRIQFDGKTIWVPTKKI